MEFQNKFNTESARQYVSEFGCELLDEYQGMNNKHKFRCGCGQEFETTFAKFQNRNKRQCNKCGRNRRALNDRYSIEEIRRKIKEFGCELVSDSYNGYKSKIRIRCVCGNEFDQQLGNYLNGTHRCPICAQKLSNEAKNKYNYSYVTRLCSENNCKLLTEKTSEYIGLKDKILLQCSCGEIFETKLFMCLTYGKFKCNSCVMLDKPISKGEMQIEEFLKSNNYNYKKQYSFSDCKNKYVLRFDFAVFVNGKTKLIEYDGKQHFRPYKYYGGEKTFRVIQERDAIKNEYCVSNSIPLLRINYNTKQDVDNLLNEFLAA